MITVAPELAGAVDLVAWLRDRGVAVSLGHSGATVDQARAGYAAGASSTTHLFNAMSGVDHRTPGLAVAALLDDEVYVELIADGIHVDPQLWPIITRLKPADRLMLVSDAIYLAGTGDGRGQIGGLDCEVVGERVTLAGTSTLAARFCHSTSRCATSSLRACHCRRRSLPPAAILWHCSASPIAAASPPANAPTSSN